MTIYKISFFGKGGIGKTTIAANLAYLISKFNKKVLMVGCDPKMDSARLLLKNEVSNTFTENLTLNINDNPLDKSVYKSILSESLYCMEVGGPKAGIGCAGVGIGSMIDLMQSNNFLNNYDYIIFDVLGDIVCGGFAGPLREGFSDIMFIVTSEELASIYAANRLIEMAYRYKTNGLKKIFLVANLKNVENRDNLIKFSKMSGIKIISWIERDVQIANASDKNRLAIETNPKSKFAAEIAKIYKAILTKDDVELNFKPLNNYQFLNLSKNSTSIFLNDSNNLLLKYYKNKKDYLSKDLKEIISKYKIIFKGIKHNQLILVSNLNEKEFSFLVIPAEFSKGKIDFKDWFICIDPQQVFDNTNQRDSITNYLYEIKKELSNFNFEQIYYFFTRQKRDLFKEIIDKHDKIKTMPLRPISSNVQWNRFIFYRGFEPLFMPPGTLVIEHGDLECKFSSDSGGSLSMLNASNSKILFPKEDKNIVNDELNDSDIIMGDDKKLKNILNSLSSAKTTNLIEIYNCCTPILLASDKSFIKNTKNKTLYIENFNSINEKTFEKKVDNRINFITKNIKKIHKKGIKKPYDLNFINIDISKNIQTILKENNLKILFTGQKTPQEDFYTYITQTKTNIIKENDEVLEKSFINSKVKYKKLKLPFGLKNTRFFLNNIIGFKKTNSIFNKWNLEITKTLKENLNYSIGIILNETEIPILIYNNFFKEIPFFDILIEMNFKIHVFVFSDNEHLNQNTKETILKLKKIKFIFFKTPIEMIQKLKENNIRLVYSDVKNDERLWKHGINFFSDKIFEQGIEGFLLTSKRIKRLINWFFYEKYSSFTNTK